MEIGAIRVLILLSAVLATSSGLPVKYDQRQDGDLNVHAHLENFIIVLIPNNGALSLLDFIPLKRDASRLGSKTPATQSDRNLEKYAALSTAVKSTSPDFPAAKSPYKVDLDKKPGAQTSSAGDGTPSTPVGGEVLIAQSPPVSLSKSPSKTESPPSTISTGSASSDDTTAPEVSPGQTKKEDTDEADDESQDKGEVREEKEAEVPVVVSGPQGPAKSSKAIDFAVEVPSNATRKASEAAPIIDVSPKAIKLSKMADGESEPGNADSEEAANRVKQLSYGLEELCRDSPGNCRRRTKSRYGVLITSELKAFSFLGVFHFAS
jgi:hypothetical protein